MAEREVLATGRGGVEVGGGYPVAGYAAALSAAVAVVWWVMTGLLQAGGGAAWVAPGEMVVRSVYVVTVSVMVALTALQMPVFIGLTVHTWRFNREVGVLGGLLTAVYLVFSVVAGYIRALAMHETVATWLDGPGATGTATLLARLVMWGQGHPYAVTFGLGLPASLLFAATALVFGVALSRRPGAERTAGSLLLAGVILGLAGWAIEAVTPALFTWLMAAAAVTTVVAYGFLAHVFLKRR